MFENIEKALTIMVLAIGVKLNGEDGHVKKKEKQVCLDETMVKKPSRKHRNGCFRHNKLHLR